MRTHTTPQATHNLRSVNGVTLFVVVCAIVIGWLSSCTDVYAGGLSMTVSPSLIQVNLSPGDHWASAIQVVNGNPYDLAVQTSVARMLPDGELGRPRLVDLNTEGTTTNPFASSSVTHWISLPVAPHVIGREQTWTMPVAIDVPTDAEPGGYYAAVLVGTSPRDEVRGMSQVSVTSSIASLIFIRVAGDVVEKGMIREFSTDRTWSNEPEARFTVRFENVGNVHVQPQGYIMVYNMFGKERGKIPINMLSEGFGNVLPGSTRNFVFSWRSGASRFDIGRYRADVTLSYGATDKQFTQASVFFYVLPIVPALEVALFVALSIMLFGWALRTYVRRAISLETQHGYDTTVAPEHHGASVPSGQTPPPARVRARTLLRPLETGLIDLRSVTTRTETPIHQTARSQNHVSMTFGEFFTQYRVFFVSVLLIALAAFCVSVFFDDVLTYTRPSKYNDETNTVVPETATLSE